jgi:hypothetical protein
LQLQHFCAQLASFFVGCIIERLREIETAIFLYMWKHKCIVGVMRRHGWSEQAVPPTEQCGSDNVIREEFHRLAADKLGRHYFQGKCFFIDINNIFMLENICPAHFC